MASRPIRRKQANRLRKALRNTPVTMIDLVQWLKDRRYASTTGEAEKLILAGRVRSESHKLGTVKSRVPKDGAVLKLAVGRPLTDADYEERDVVQRLVPSNLRGSIQVIDA